MAKKNQKELSEKDYEKLGRLVESVFSSNYANKGRLYRLSFLRGLVFGLGSVLGGTIIIAAIAWILSLFTEIPIIGDLFETARSTVEQ